LANTKSAKKRININERKRQRNMAYRSKVKTMVKKAEQAIADGTNVEAALREAQSTLDKAAVKGIIHKNNAARRLARLAAKVSPAASA
jgi:small subunit ribosomal protein S20